MLKGNLNRSIDIFLAASKSQGSFLHRQNDFFAQSQLICEDDCKMLRIEWHNSCHQVTFMT